MTTSSDAAVATPLLAVEPRFRTALAGLRSAQKPGPGVPAYTRWINRRLARFVAAAAYSMGWSPNLVTAVSAVLSFGGLAIMVAVTPTPLVGIPVAALLALGYVFDSADGQVARLGRRGGPAGEWIDHVVDSFRTPAIHLAVLVGLSLQAQPVTWAQIVAIAYCLLSAGQFLSQILAEQLSGAAKPATESKGNLQSLVLLPTDTGILCWAFLFWGLPEVFVWVYAALFVLNLGHTAISLRRKYHRLIALGTVAP